MEAVAISPDKALIGVPANEARAVWKSIEPLVAQACSKAADRYKPDDYLTAVLARDMQLWIVADAYEIYAFVLTEIVNYPRKKYCRVEALGGAHYNEWIHLVSIIEDWAKSLDCDGMETGGRAGFEKSLIKQGWTKTMTFFEKEF